MVRAGAVALPAFRDVLFASLVLQIFALATPLFFQVVIDKVLVHRGLTTLDVLAWGLGAVIVFETGLGGLRAWLFTHTTSRVDVELVAKLYRHVLSLPWPISRAAGSATPWRGCANSKPCASS